MNIRIRRLARDYEKVVQELAASEFVKVEAVSGNPPSSYRVTYQLNGLMWDDAAGDAKPIAEHMVDIYLPVGYPEEAAKLYMRTPVWHPNIGDYVCIGDYLGAGVTLVDIIAHIGDMIQYKSYNLHSPVNKAAAAWAANREKAFPIGNRSILPADSGDSVPQSVSIPRYLDDVNIDLGPARERR